MSTSDGITQDHEVGRVPEASGHTDAANHTNDVKHAGGAGHNPYGYAADKDALLKRLRRIEGQVRGVERMVDEDRYCIDILTQISAITTALDAVALKVLEGHVNHCVASAFASGDEQEAAEKSRELLEAVQRFTRSR